MSFNTTVSFFPSFSLSSLLRLFALRVLQWNRRIHTLKFMLPYLLNIFWRICASCHSPLIRFLICERHVVKFFCVWLMIFCYVDDAYSLPFFLHYNAYTTQKKNLLLYSHIFSYQDIHIAFSHSPSLTIFLFFASFYFSLLTLNYVTRVGV